MANIQQKAGDYFPSQCVYVSASNGSKTYKNIVDIKGKGRVFVVLPESSSPAEIKITIDGREIIFSDDEPNYNVAGCCLFYQDWIVSETSSEYDTLGLSTLYSAGLEKVVLASENDVGTFSRTWFMTKHGVPFEQSLKIEHKLTSGSYSVKTKVVYTLDE